MNISRWSLSGAAAVVGACAMASTALAQEEPKETPTDEAKPDGENQQQDKPATQTQPPSAREQAIEDVETWEAAEGGKPETLQEAFFRLSRNFVATSDDGFRRLGTVPLWPRGEFKLGDIRLFPYLRQAAEWESNFYRTPEDSPQDEQSEWTHVNEAGALADLALMGGRLHISAGIDAIWRLRYGSDAPDDTFDVDSQFNVEYAWPSGVWVRAGAAYIIRNDPDDLPSIGATNFERTQTRTYFTLGTDRDIFFGSRFRFEMGVQTNFEEAEEDVYSDLDRDEYIAYVKASYPFLKDTTRIFGIARYRWDNRDSEEINDGEAVGMSVGLEGSIPLSQGAYRSLRGQISVGFDTAVYDNDEFQSGSNTVVADDNDEATTANVVVGLQYLMSPRASIDVRYLHQAEFSFYGNYQIVDRVDANFTSNLTRRLTGRLSAFYEHTNPSGSFPRETIPPTPGTGDAPDTTRIGIGAGLRWAWTDWMDIDLSTDMERSNSDLDTDYVNYRAIVGLTFYLNALTAKPRRAAEH